MLISFYSSKTATLSNVTAVPDAATNLINFANCCNVENSLRRLVYQITRFVAVGGRLAAAKAVA